MKQLLTAQQEIEKEEDEKFRQMLNDLVQEEQEKKKELLRSNERLDRKLER